MFPAAFRLDEMFAGGRLSRCWAGCNGWLRPHKGSAEETGNLLAIARRDIKDAGKEDISDDWRFGIAYNAALKLCTILLYAEGYRPEKNLQHFRTIQALPLILGGHGRRCPWNYRR